MEVSYSLQIVFMSISKKTLNEKEYLKNIIPLYWQYENKKLMIRIN